MATDLIAAGNLGLDRGDWASARTAFESFLVHDETAEALDGLGQALWWLNEVRLAIEFRERAFAMFKAGGDVVSAAKVATWLAREYFTVHGNLPAAGGWIQRAESLLGGGAACSEQGWLGLMKAAMAPRPSDMQALATQAVGLAKELGDADLEMVALSALGLGLVCEGRVADGMAALDESMAAATGGEVRSLWAISDVYCNTLLACERAGDFERAEQWCRVVTEFARRRACKPMFPFCHVTYGAILTGTGRWAEAEVELELAVRTFDVGHRAMRVLALGRLADLRLRQGRLEEAEQLLVGYEDHPLTLRPVVRLHIARGRVGLAVSMLRRRLDQVTGTLLSAPLLVLLVDAALEQDDPVAARAWADSLLELARGFGKPAIEAEAALAAGRVALAQADPAATPLLQRALDLFVESELPWESARARIALARSRALEEPEVALADARLALAAFDQLGARHDADAAAQVLRDLGAGSPPGPKGFGPLTRREEEVLELVGAGLSNTEISGRLFISVRTAEHHVGRVLAKLGLKTRAQMIAYAARQPGGRPGPI